MSNEMPNRGQYSNDLAGFHNFVQAIAETMFEMDGVSGRAIVVAEKKGVVSPALLCSDGDPDQFRADMQVLLEEISVDRAAKVDQCWVTRYSKGKVPDIAPAPSRDPKREEMIRIVARERGGEGLMSLAEITRPAGGMPRLASWESVPVKDGPLLGMVHTHTISPRSGIRAITHREGGLMAGAHDQDCECAAEELFTADEAETCPHICVKTEPAKLPISICSKSFEALLAERGCHHIQVQRDSGNDVVVACLHRRRGRRLWASCRRDVRGGHCTT